MAVSGRTGIFPGKIDRVTDGLAALPHEHLKIHGERHFFCTDSFNETDDGTFQAWAIFPPSNSYITHLDFQVDCSGHCVINFREGATLEASVGISSYNNDRNSIITPYTSIATTAAIVGAGTLLWHAELGRSTTYAPVTCNLARANEEFLLKYVLDQVYVLSVTLDADSDDTCSVRLRWYEHLEVE